jgi:hypothetical protein
VAVDVRESELSAAALAAAYEAKARAELGDADAIAAAMPGAWAGTIVGPRIAFVVGEPHGPGPEAPLLDERAAGAVSKAADALGAHGAVFTIASQPAGGAGEEARGRRLRLALEAVDPIAVIALDAHAADDLAAAFGMEDLRPGRPVRVAGRTLGSAGDFASSLGDPDAKAKSWIAMKAIAAAAGLEAKARSKPRGESPSAGTFAPGATIGG